MQLFLVTSLFIALTLYLYFFVNKTSQMAYKIQTMKKEQEYEDACVKVFHMYKYGSYIILFILLVAGIFVAPNIRLTGWMYLYYLLIIISLFFVRTNINLIDHLVNVVYVRSSLKKIEKDFLIGAVIKEKHRYCFLYRLKKEKIYI